MGYVKNKKEKAIVSYKNQSLASNKEKIRVSSASQNEGIKSVSTPKILAVLLVFAIVSVLMMLMINNMMIKNECTIRSQQLEKRADELNQTIEKLSVELEKKNDLLTVEQYAQSVLGMVGEETLDSEYIEGESDDGVELHEDSEDTEDLFATVMNALGENLISAWNSLQKSE